MARDHGPDADAQLSRLRKKTRVKRELVEAWEALVSEEDPLPAARHFMAESLIKHIDPEGALRILKGDEAIRAWQLRGLAFSRRGRPGDDDRALQILEDLWQMRDQFDAATLSEAGGLLAGRYKERYLRESEAPSGDATRPWLLMAFRAYDEAWKATGNTYPGINCAFTALMLERRDYSRLTAFAVIEALERTDRGRRDEWHYATLGEARLLMADPADGDALAAATDAYEMAVALNPVGNLAVMRRQARMALGKLGFAKDALDEIFPLKKAAAFTGHLTDESDRETERFPAGLEEEVVFEIRQQLRTLDVGFGVSSAARGGDILFLEELLRRGGSAKVILPFPRDDFVTKSVGAEWSARLGRVLSHPMVHYVELLDELPREQDEIEDAFARCNEKILDEARGLARRVDQDPPMLIALWDGEPGSVGGTAATVAASRDQGFQVVEIRLGPSGHHEGPSGADTPPVPPDRGRKGSREDATLEFQEPTSRFCLAVGVDTYPYDDTLESLHNAERDARNFADVLEAKHAFEVTKRVGENATRSNIERVIWDQLKPRVQPDSLVVFYFSGHGILEDDRYYFAPYDAEEGSRVGWISLGDLAEWIAALGKSKQQLWIFDTCHSGLVNALPAYGNLPRVPDRCRFALTSGRSTERVSDGDAGEGSPFAQALLSAMTSGPGDHHDDTFTVYDLYSFLRKEVKKAKQSPEILPLTGHANGDIVFRVPTST